MCHSVQASLYRLLCADSIAFLNFFMLNLTSNIYSLSISLWVPISLALALCLSYFLPRPLQVQTLAHISVRLGRALPGVCIVCFVEPSLPRPLCEK